MAHRFTRDEIFEKFHRTLSEGHPIILTGAGTGLSAKCAVEGGADMVSVYNSGKYRMDGSLSSVGRMHFGNANDIVLELGNRVSPLVGDVPLCAGICGSDPRDMETYFKILQFYGFSAVMNFPTVGDIHCTFRDNLEKAGLGVEKEIERLALAKSMGLFTLAYAYDEWTAELVAKADLDVCIVHLGLTKGGSFITKSADKMTMPEAAQAVNRIAGAARAIKPDIIVMSHGGPISTPTDTEYIYEHTCSQGFLGASSTERIPIEQPIKNTVMAFKSVTLRD